jgi:hypothetical protein
MEMINEMKFYSGLMEKDKYLVEFLEKFDKTKAASIADKLEKEAIKIKNPDVAKKMKLVAKEFKDFAAEVEEFEKKKILAKAAVMDKGEKSGKAAETVAKKASGIAKKERIKELRQQFLSLKEKHKKFVNLTHKVSIFLKQTGKASLAIAALSAALLTLRETRIIMEKQTQQVGNEVKSYLHEPGLEDIAKDFLFTIKSQETRDIETTGRVMSLISGLVGAASAGAYVAGASRQGRAKKAYKASMKQAATHGKRKSSKRKAKKEKEAEEKDFEGKGPERNANPTGIKIKPDLIGREDSIKL